MGDNNKVLINESLNYLRRLYENLNNQQSSTGKIPALYPKVNHNLNDETGEFIPTGVYYCTKCNIAKYIKAIAEQCCQPRICDCGREAKQYYTACESCSQEEREAKEITKFLNNHKYTNEEYDDEIFIEDEYYESIYDYVEPRCFENLDDVYAYAGKIESLKVNVDNVIDMIKEWMTEEWEELDYDTIVGVDELRQALEKFNSVQSQKLTVPDYKTGILYTKEYLQKLMRELES